jgi:energy-converting hydrogenase Eha subunit C
LECPLIIDLDIKEDSMVVVIMAAANTVVVTMAAVIMAAVTTVVVTMAVDLI